MSRAMGNGKSNNNIPPPPPPPPPLKNFPSERLPKLKTKSNIPSMHTVSKRIPTDTQRKARGYNKSDAPLKTLASNLVRKDDESTSDANLIYQVRKQYTESEKNISQQRSKSRHNRESELEIVRSDVPFYNEEECSDPEDEFSFPCCLQPDSPRYPPNPRRYRDWDPSFLPSSTNVPTSIGKRCRRCGKPVYVAELYLSSRGVYHTECYKCCLCGKTLDSWTVAEYKGEIFCKGCYRRNFGTHGIGFGVGAGVLQTP